jgi:hypothetical protein
VLAAQRADAFEKADRLVAAVSLPSNRAVGEIAVRQRQALGDAHDILAGLLEPVGDLRAIDVVDADDRGFAAGNQPLLDRRSAAWCRGGRDDPASG